MTKYIAQIQLNPESKDMGIVDANGTVLSFNNIFHALNYLSTQGWELVELSKQNPDNNSFRLEQYALIKKKFPVEKAIKYCEPIVEKQKK